MGRVEAATATGDAIRRWKPRYLLLVSIGGGIAAQSVSLGDVIIADFVVDYELQKETAQSPEVRYTVHRADPRLVGAGKHFRDLDWESSITIDRLSNAGGPKRLVGPIATGDKVVAFRKILDRYSAPWPKLIGVEMEAGGVASTCFEASQPPGFFMVRAVSDLADEDKDAPDVRS